MGGDAVIVSSHLPGEGPVHSERYRVLGVECAGDFSYWAGLNQAWCGPGPVVNVEHDMGYSDELVAELLECPRPACAFAYQVFPTALQRFIYCATTTTTGEATRANGIPCRWIEEGEDMAVWSSIGFCKVAQPVRIKPLDKMFWQWLEHCVNRVIAFADVTWHIHWPAVVHNHDYTTTPDHLW